MNMVDLPREGAGLDLPDSPPDLAELREHIANALPGTTDRQAVKILLVTAELVRNAYRHAEEPRRLRLARVGDVTRVEVDDGSPSRLPVLGRFDAPGQGHGLLMVNRLSVGWGCRPEAGRKTVWAEIGPA